MKTPLTAATELICVHEKCHGIARPAAIAIAIDTASRLVQNSVGMPILHDYWLAVENILCKIKASEEVGWEAEQQESTEQVAGTMEEPKREAIVGIVDEINEKVVNSDAATAFMRRIDLLPEGKKDLTITVLDGEQKTFHLSNLLREFCIQTVADAFMNFLRK